MTIKTILYASDTLEGSRAVFKYAIQAAKIHKAKLIYVHVLAENLVEQELKDKGYLPLEIKARHRQNQEDEESQRVLTRIERFLAKQGLNQDSDLTIEIQLCYGRPSKAILKLAKKIPADLIVLGNRSSNTLTQFFLGSTTQNVIRKSNVPVVVVPIN